MRVEGWDGRGDGENGEGGTKCSRETETTGGRGKEDKVEKKNRRKKKNAVVRE